VKIQAHTYGDLFYVVCGDCLTKAQNEFAGPGQLLIYCPTCQQSDAWKLDAWCWSGITGPALSVAHERDDAPVRHHPLADYSRNAEAGQPGANRRAA